MRKQMLQFNLLQNLFYFIAYEKTPIEKEDVRLCNNGDCVKKRRQLNLV